MSSYYPAANGTRGLAVIIVLVTHGLVMFFNKSQIYLSGTGKIGVWLFFVLSAFLLTTKFIDSGLTKDSFIKYLAGRFFRIIPIFIISALFYYFVGYYDSSVLLDIISMRKGFAHLWTIPVEFKFYFMLPIFFLIFRFAHDKFGLFGVCVFTLFSITTLQLFFPYWLVAENDISTSWYIPCFMFGILASFTIKDEKGIISGTKLKHLAPLSILAILLTIPAIQNLIFGVGIKTPLGNKFIYISFFWAVFISFTFTTPSLINSLLSSRPMTFIGKNSFSTYLFHWYILTEISEKNPGSFVWMAASIIISITVGYAVFLTIENPIEKARHYLINGFMKNGEAAS